MVDAQVQSAATGRMTAFERAQIRVEHLKAWLTAVSIIGSATAAILTYSSTQRTQSQQAAVAQRTQSQEDSVAFDLKAAEIVMAGRGAWEAKGRARMLAALFPHRISRRIADSLNLDSLAYGREGKRELLMLLTAHPAFPKHRAVVLKTYKALFPDDTFANKVTP
jgi:hypothetical protein